MSLRTRAILFSSLTFIISVTILYLASQVTLLRSYEQIEAQETSDDLQRVVNEIQNNIQYFERIALSYSQWNDTRDFISTNNVNYVRDNLSNRFYINVGLDIAIFSNTQGQIIFQKAVNRQNNTENSVPRSLMELLQKTNFLLKQTKETQGFSGIISLPEGNLILISLPILNSQGNGSANGYLIWGRFVDTEMMQQLIENTRINAQIVPYNLSEDIDDYRTARQALTSAQPFFIQALDAQSIEGFSVIRDLYQQPALLVRVASPRLAYQQGKNNLIYFLIALILLTFVSSAIALLVLNSALLARLHALSTSVGRIQATNDLTIPITIGGKDELAHLAHGIRLMLLSLGQSRADLQENNLRLEQHVNERTEQLERAKNRIEVIFNHSADGIVLVDLENGIQQGNIAFNQLFKSAQDAFFKQPLGSLVDPADRDRLQSMIESVIQSHIAQQFELVCLRSDATLFDAEISLSSFSPFTNLICIIRDISVRKHMQQAIAEERNLLRTLIDAVPDFIYIKDTQHRLILNNAAHARTLGGIQPADLVGKTDYDLFPADMAANFHADEAVLFATGNPLFNREERSIGQDGNEIWALTTKVPLRNLNGEVIGLVGITHDVSGIKASEEALRQSKDKLRLALDKERELGELKSRFVSMASHEFRTPLTIINNNAYILQKSLPPKVDTNTQARLVTIVNQVKYLSEIVDEVIDFNRGESQDFTSNLVKMDLSLFCTNIIHEFQNLAQDEHQFECRMPLEPIWIQLHPVAMRKVITNLLSNAQKYSVAGTKIWITLEKLETTACLSVRDEGIGIPIEDQRQLFEAFHRAGNVGTVRGTGLGLVITKQAVEQHGGSITFVSQTQIGTTFTIILPLTDTKESDPISSMTSYPNQMY